MASWRDNIRQVEPYVPGEQPKNTNVIKLNTNENPYGPSPRVKAVQDNEDLLRYIRIRRQAYWWTHWRSIMVWMHHRYL